MNKEEKKNYFYSIIYRLSICVLPLIVTPYVARVLGAENTGLYAFSSTVVCYFIMFGKLGLDNYGSRTIASCRDDPEKRSVAFWGIFIMQMITSIISVFIYIMLTVTVFKENREIYWLQLMYVGSALFDYSWFFYGLEKFRITTVRSLVSRLLIIILVFIFVRSKSDLPAYTGIMAGCFLLEQVQLIPFIIGKVKKVPLKKEDILCHMVPNLKLFVPLLALSVYNWMDKIMLGAILKSTAVVAFYTYSENIINLPKGLLTALDTVMLPRISNLAAGRHREEGIRKMLNSLEVNSFIGCALSFGIAGIAPSFIPWFLGPEFKPSVILTMQLSAAMIPMAVTSVIQTQYLIPFKREIIYIKSVSLGAVINFLLNSMLIPFYGAVGAVIGTISAEVAVCVYQIIRIRDILSLKDLTMKLFPFLICGALEFSITYTLNNLNINVLLRLVIQVIAGGCVYIGSCIIYSVYIKKEYKNFKELVERIQHT